MKKIITVVFIMLLLPGCIPAAFVAGAAAGGAIIYDHRSTKNMVDDRNVTFQIQHKIDHDKELREQAHVSIATFNNIALLLGQAPNDELRNRAVTIVKSTAQVKMLYNEVTIEKPTSDITRANDAWITTKVKTILLATPDLNSTNLKIVTENSTVYLMGLTTRTQAQVATDKTRTAAGVKKVVKLFEYLN
jgi:Predicted periplasmic or secreted lipoprotein